MNIIINEDLFIAELLSISLFGMYLDIADDQNISGEQSC